MVQRHLLGRHAEPGGQPTLEADGHVAQPDGAVPLVHQRLGDDADRVGEVDDPGVRARPAGDISAMLRTTGTVRSALANPPAPVVSCPISRTRVAGSRRGAPPDRRRGAGGARSGAIERRRRPSWTSTGRGPWLARMRRARPPTIRAVRVEVEQHQLVDLEPRAGGEALDQLRGIGAAPADHRDLQAPSHLRACVCRVVARRRRVLRRPTKGLPTATCL